MGPCLRGMQPGLQPPPAVAQLLAGEIEIHADLVAQSLEGLQAVVHQIGQVGFRVLALPSLLRLTAVAPGDLSQREGYPLQVDLLGLLPIAVPGRAPPGEIVERDETAQTPLGIDHDHAMYRLGHHEIFDLFDRRRGPTGLYEARHRENRGYLP